MTHSQGFLSALSAFSGNLLVTVLKFIGFFMTGSGTLFSEAIHSVADVTNQALLLIGIKRSEKKADENFPYGYASERFFWALISACSIFFLGAGITIKHGLESFFSPEHVEMTAIAFVILIVSFIIEFATLVLAYKELTKNNPGMPLKKALKDGDPSTIAVLYEDGVAVIGVVIALISITLTKNHWRCEMGRCWIFAYRIFTRAAGSNSDKQKQSIPYQESDSEGNERRDCRTFRK